MKAVMDEPPDKFIYDYRIYYCCRLPVDEPCDVCRIRATKAWVDEDGPESPRSVWQMAFRAGQRDQAEKDAEIADQYAEAMSGSIETHLAYQASTTIAAAIRAAAPKEEA